MTPMITGPATYGGVLPHGGPTTYTVVLPKGGTGKSTTAAEAAWHLALLGRRVLAIDFDRQGNLTTRLGIPTAQARGAAVTAKDVVLGSASAREAAMTSPISANIDVIVPGGARVHELEQHPEALTGLRDYLPELAGEWDAVVIDTPPADGMATLSALAAADQVLVPCACITEAFDQTAYLADLIATRIEPRIRKGQHITWVLPTLYDRRRLLDREIVDELGVQFPGRVTPPIREAQVVKDSFNAGQPVGVYAPTAPVSADYRTALTVVTQHTPNTENTLQGAR